MDCFHYPLDTSKPCCGKSASCGVSCWPRTPPLHKKSPSSAVRPPTKWPTSWGCFLLQYGIEAEFYQSEYAQYWQGRHVRYARTGRVPPGCHLHPHQLAQLTALPTTADTAKPTLMPCWTRSMPILRQCGRRWTKIRLPGHPRITLTIHYRLMGNRDIWDPRLPNFISRLNQKFYAYAAAA